MDFSGDKAVAVLKREVGLDLDDIIADKTNEADETATKVATATDAATLRHQQSLLQEQLKACMNSGDAAGVIRIQNLLRDIPTRLVAMDVAEINIGISNATARLAEVEQEIDYVTEMRKANNKVLAEKIIEAEAAQMDVRRNDFALEILKMEKTSLHQARREYRLKLEQIIEDTGGK